MSTTELYVTPSHFFVSKFAQGVLQIDRKSGKTASLVALPSTVSATNKISTSFGLLGNIRLISGHFLVHIVQAQVVDELIPGHKVYVVSGVELIPYDEDAAKNLNAAQKADEDKYKTLIFDLFNGYPRSFYFCYTFDMTVSLQNTFIRKSNNDSSSVWRCLIF